jgi:hypothetical protein
MSFNEQIGSSLDIQHHQIELAISVTTESYKIGRAGSNTGYGSSLDMQYPWWISSCHNQ